MSEIKNSATIDKMYSECEGKSVVELDTSHLAVYYYIRYGEDSVKKLNTDIAESKVPLTRAIPALALIKTMKIGV